MDDEGSQASGGATPEHCSYEEAASTSNTTTARSTQFSVPTPTRPPHAIRKQSSQLLQVSRKRKLADINDTIDKLNAIQTSDKEDEFDCFGKLIASQLRKMPELEALMCMEKIEDDVRKQRLKILRNASPGSSSPRYSSTSPSPGESVAYSPPSQMSEQHSRNELSNMMSEESFGDDIHNYNIIQRAFRNS